MRFLEVVAAIFVIFSLFYVVSFDIFLVSHVDMANSQLCTT